MIDDFPQNPAVLRTYSWEVPMKRTKMDSASEQKWRQSNASGSSLSQTKGRVNVDGSATEDAFGRFARELGVLIGKFLADEKAAVCSAQRPQAKKSGADL